MFMNLCVKNWHFLNNIQSTKKMRVLKPSSMPFSEDKYFFIEVLSLSFELPLLVVISIIFLYFKCVCVEIRRK